MDARLREIMLTLHEGSEITDDDARLLATTDELAALLDAAARLWDRDHRDLISYSRKVFIPLTQLCRDKVLAIPPVCGSNRHVTVRHHLAFSPGTFSGSRAIVDRFPTF